MELSRCYLTESYQGVLWGLRIATYMPACYDQRLTGFVIFMDFADIQHVLSALRGVHSGRDNQHFSDQRVWDVNKIC